MDTDLIDPTRDRVWAVGEVWLCAFRATSLADDLSWLRRMAREAMAHEL